MESCILRMHKNTWVSFVRVRTVEDYRLQFTCRFAYSLFSFQMVPHSHSPPHYHAHRKETKMLEGGLVLYSRLQQTSDLRRVKNAFIRVRL